MLRSNFPYQHLRPLFMIEYFRWEAMPEKCKDEFWEQKNVFYIIKALSKTGDHKNFLGRPKSNGLCWAMRLWSGLQRAAAGMAGRGWAGLGLGVDGAHKKWHSLVCAFSLGHLAAWILIKWFWCWCLECAARAVALWLLVSIQCLAIILLVVEVFVSVILQTWHLKT